MQALRPQRLGDLVLVLTLAVEEEEATATGAGDFAAPGTRVPGHLIPLVDPGIGDAGGQLTLGRRHHRSLDRPVVSGGPGRGCPGRQNRRRRWRWLPPPLLRA